MLRERQTTGNPLEPIQAVLFNLPQGSPEITRRPPQPGKKFVNRMTVNEIKHYLDLKQKGVLSDWLKKLEFNREEILSSAENEVIGTYLFPREDGRWLSQSEIVARIGIPKGNTEVVRKIALSGLTKLCRREVYGPAAIEILRLPQSLYRHLVEANVCKLEDFARLNTSLIKQICPTAQDLKSLQNLLQERGYFWNPQVQY